MKRLVIFTMIAVTLSLSLAVGFTSSSSALYSKSTIDKNLRQGVASAEGWDKSCFDYLKHFQGSINSGKYNVRSVINGSPGVYNGTKAASYKGEMWLSQRNHPKAIAPIKVDYGATSVNLDVNFVEYICGPLVGYDYKVPVNNNTAQQKKLAANLLKHSSTRWFQYGATDSKPLYNGRSQGLAKRYVSYRPLSATVTKGGGSISGLTTSPVVQGKDDSRYWFTDAKKVKYHSNSPIIKKKTITVKLKYQTGSGYSTPDVRCTLPSGKSKSMGKVAVSKQPAFLKKAGNYKGCKVYERNLKMTIDVNSNWSVTPTVKADRSTAKVGDTIKWTHSVKNNGPTITNKKVSYRYKNANGLGSGNGSTSQWTAGAKKGKTSTFSSTYKVKPSDAGKKLCRLTDAWPRSSASNAHVTTGQACVTVPFDYELTPGVDVPITIVEPKEPIPSVDPGVDNGGSTKSEKTRWQLSQVVVEPGGTIPGGLSINDSNTAPCTTKGGFSGGSFFNDPPKVSCESLKKGKDKVFDAGASEHLGNLTNIENDYEVGTRICFVLSVSPYTQKAGAKQWRHSEPACVVVGKKPKLQAHGGDVLAGGNIDTSTSQRSGKTYGSWVEYAAFSVQRNQGFGSESGLSKGNSSNMQGDWSQLTFSNDDRSNLGYFGELPLTKSIALELGGQSDSQTLPGATLSDSQLTGLNGNYTHSGPLTLRGGTIKKGHSVTIEVDGDVTIDGNITYDNGPFSNLRDIPRLVIIANNINITHKPTQVDAWLVALGKVNTCSDAPASLTIKTCKDRLTVNGAVVTKDIVLDRTAGSTKSKAGAPAEVFNLNASDYLWGAGRSSGDQRIQTTYTRELAPRF